MLAKEMHNSDEINSVYNDREVFVNSPVIKIHELHWPKLPTSPIRIQTQNIYKPLKLKNILSLKICSSLPLAPVPNANMHNVHWLVANIPNSYPLVKSCVAF